MVMVHAAQLPAVNLTRIDFSNSTNYSPFTSRSPQEVRVGLSFECVQYLLGRSRRAMRNFANVCTHTYTCVAHHGIFLR